MGLLNLMEAAARFAAVEADLEAVRRPMLEVACQMVAERAKDMIGDYQKGWAPLQPETIARKAMGDSPLLETGEMRDSIQWNADSESGHVGSNNDKAVWQELGTNRGIPPRPFLSLAAQEEGPAVAKMMAGVIGAAVGGRLATGSRVGEFFELAHKLGEALRPIKDMGEDLLSPDEEQRR
jgi:phage gpG-like protein